MKDRFPLIEIEWYDSMSFRDAYWNKVSVIMKNIKETKPLKTIGYLLACTKHHVLIAQTMYADERGHYFGGYFTIPIGAIINIKYVNKKGDKKNKRQ